MLQGKDIPVRSGRVMQPHGLRASPAALPGQRAAADAGEQEIENKVWLSKRRLTLAEAAESRGGLRSVNTLRTRAVPLIATRFTLRAHDSGRGSPAGVRAPRTVTTDSSASLQSSLIRAIPAEDLSASQHGRSRCCPLALVQHLREKRGTVGGATPCHAAPVEEGPEDRGHERLRIQDQVAPDAPRHRPERDLRVKGRALWKCDCDRGEGGGESVLPPSHLRLLPDGRNPFRRTAARPTRPVSA